jgi:hypothetical protein
MIHNRRCAIHGRIRYPKQLSGLFVPALLVCGLAISAQAGSVTFTFDTLSAGATEAQIATYMTNLLVAAGCTGCSVTIPTTDSGGGVLQGAVTDTTYNGDGYVTGPGTGTKSLTLGDSTGATASNTTSTVNSSYDTFLANTNNSSSQISNQITLQFQGFTGDTFTVNSFDYEIFPCADGVDNCTSPPDLTFEAGNNTNGVDNKVTSFGSSGVASGVEPGTTNGNSVTSPNGNVHSTTDDQYIGTWTTGASFTGNTELDFIDWPATIGIDNLSITWTTPPSSVPEPASFLLLGSALLGVGIALKRKNARSALKG